MRRAIEGHFPLELAVQNLQPSGAGALGLVGGGAGPPNQQSLPSRVVLYSNLARVDSGELRDHDKRGLGLADVYIGSPAGACTGGDPPPNHLVAQALQFGAELPQKLVLPSLCHLGDYVPAGGGGVQSGRMKVVVSILFVLLVAISGLFIFVTVLFGSKSDAMSGGSSQIRTTFKGKAGFDDFVSRLTLYLGIAFMALCVIINVIQTRGWDR